MINNTRVKESVFCYWCSIYEEELMKAKELENIEVFINKVLISELEKTKYQQRIFLTIENNRTHILESGSEINFIEIKEKLDTRAISLTYDNNIVDNLLLIPKTIINI